MITSCQCRIESQPVCGEGGGFWCFGDVVSSHSLRTDGLQVIFAQYWGLARGVKRGYGNRDYRLKWGHWCIQGLLWAHEIPAVVSVQ